MSKLPTEEKIYELWLKLLKHCEAKDWLPTKNLWLGVLDITRQTYSRWIKKSDAIKKVDKEIENAWVQRLKLNNVAGIIFYLKNAFGYRDRQDLDLMSGGQPIAPFDYVKRTRKNRNNDGDGENTQTKETN